jgi:hypothetical protein
MSGRSRKPTFLGEAVFGLVISLTAAAVALTLSFVMPAAFVTRLVIAGLGLAVVVRAIARSDERTGRIVTLVVWIAAAAAVWFSGVGLPIFVVVHVTLVWLVRSLFSYSRFVDAGVDLGLTLLAVSFAIFAAVRTESVFLAAWCFLLIQALHVAIPGLVSSWTAPREKDIPVGDSNRGFADAFKAADEALHRIAGQRLAQSNFK